MKLTINKVLVNLQIRHDKPFEYLIMTECLNISLFIRICGNLKATLFLNKTLTFEQFSLFKEKN